MDKVLATSRYHYEIKMPVKDILFTVLVLIIFVVTTIPRIPFALFRIGKHVVAFDLKSK